MKLALWGVAFVLALLYPGTWAARIVKEGETCYDVKTISTADPEKVFNSVWVEVRRSDNDVESAGTCSEIQAELFKTAGMLTHTSSGKPVTGFLRVSELDRMTINYNDVASMIVVDTDNENYAILYSCNENVFQERVWVLGKTFESVPDQVLIDLQKNHTYLHDLLTAGVTCKEVQTTMKQPLSTSTITPTTTLSPENKCFDVHNKENLDLDKMSLVDWVEVARSRNVFEKEDNCGTVKYIYNSLTLMITHKYEDEKDIVKAYGTVNTTTELQIQVSFPGQGTLMSNYFIVDTDYDNFAVVYSCGQLPDSKKEQLWILSRQAEAGNDLLTSVLKPFGELQELLSDSILCKGEPSKPTQEPGDTTSSGNLPTTSPPPGDNTIPPPGDSTPPEHFTIPGIPYDVYFVYQFPQING